MRRMQHIRVIVTLAVLAVILVAAWLTVRGNGEETSPYRFAAVERGDLEAIVSATGKLGAVTTVQVGTQVSGQIAEIHVDFNDRVKQGQLIARIDPTLQQQAVRDAQAGLERNRAELEKAQRDYDRSAQLYERKVLTEIEFNDARYALAVARANVKSAEVTLERARQNLEYTSIFAPIDGIVVERNVNVGQTVAASLNTPQLFLIANDLSHMQILASVDESDIGMIREKQPVRFSVQAYPNDSFTGTVQQVRLQSTTQENVVNYTVVVEVENPDGRLLPGMTATVEFIAGSAQAALLVPNAALRFRPTEAMWAEVRARMGANRERRQQDGQQDGNSGRGEQGTQAGSAERSRSEWRQGGGGRRANGALLWYVDGEGNLAIARVRTGITDGQRTQIESAQVREGMQIIVGALPAAAPESNNPFQRASSTGGRRPPGTF
jgi:HlyD family secretion protein